MIVDFNDEPVIIPDALIMILLPLLHQPDPVSDLLREPLHLLPRLQHPLLYLLLDLAHLHTTDLPSVDHDLRWHLLDPVLTLLHQHLLLMHYLLPDRHSAASVLLSFHLQRKLLLRLPQLVQALDLLSQALPETVNLREVLLARRLLRKLQLQLVDLYSHLHDLPHKHVIVGSLLSLRDLHGLRGLLEREEVVQLGLDGVSQRLDLRELLGHQLLELGVLLVG